MVTLGFFSELKKTPKKQAKNALFILMKGFSGVLL